MNQIIEFVKWTGITPSEVKDVLGVFVVLFIVFFFNKVI
jgi:hypothetical protein